MWERTLQDLIRGLRSHKHSSKLELDNFIDEALEEIRGELKGKDMDLKSEGVLKMCYLMMLYPLPPPPSFAFHVVEVMSSQRYHLKQIGYIAAPVAFSADTEEVVLTVNGMRKDLLSPNPHLPPLALSGLADIITPSLAREVNHDVLSLLSHSKPQVRKRAVLALFKIFQNYPDALRTGFGRLREKLEDEDAGVVSATINVITELSRKSNPKNYLPLAPQLFEILTTSTNNWMLIKVVKLFATLTPLEPRLVRKLLPPLTNLISTTPAISLLYECVRTCIVGGMLDADKQGEAGDALARVVVEKLSGFLSDEDQNLKYIALLAMVKIVPSHPHLVAEYQEEIMKSVDDADVSIRMRALELTSAMVNRRNIREVVTHLLSHLVPPSTTTTSTLPSAMASLARSAGTDTPPPANATPTILSPAYRLEVVKRILHMTSYDTYTNISHFEWYISVLLDLTYVSGVEGGGIGEDIRDDLLDVVGRVKSVRKFAVGVLSRVLADSNFLEGCAEAGGCGEVVYAAAWICGEHSGDLYDKRTTIINLLQPQVLALDPITVSVCVLAATKIFGAWAAQVSEDWSVDKFDDAKSLVKLLVTKLDELSGNDELEVQERASNSLQLFKFIEADLANHTPPSPATTSATASSSTMPDMPNGFQSEAPVIPPPNYPKSLFLIQPLSTGFDLNPVGYKAQESVRLPEGLDLDVDLVQGGLLGDNDDDELPEESEDQIELGEGGGAGMEELRRVLRESEGKGGKGKGKAKRVGSGPDGAETKEERAARRAARKARQRDDPYYLNDKQDITQEDIDSIPIVKLELDDEASSPLRSTKKSSKGSRRRKEREPSPPPPEFDRGGEMPEGAEAIAPPTKSKGKAVDRTPSPNPDSLKGVDLTAPGNGGSHTAAAPTSRFEEYQVDGEDSPASAPAQETEVAAVASPAAMEVVKVKKKKKTKAGASSKIAEAA